MHFVFSHCFCRRLSFSNNICMYANVYMFSPYIAFFPKPVDTVILRYLLCRFGILDMVHSSLLSSNIGYNMFIQDSSSIQDKYLRENELEEKSSGLKEEWAQVVLFSLYFACHVQCRSYVFLSP